MAGPLTPKLRENILNFVKNNAGDDIIIAAGLRTMHNVEDAETLRTFINNFKPGLNPADYLGAKPSSTMTQYGEVEKAKTRDESPETPADLDIEYEDLGPVPKKLGANGQAIEALMKKKSDHDFSVAGLRDTLKIPESKIKPMLALLLERNIIKRTGSATYQIK